MTKGIHNIILVTWIARLLRVTYGACNDRELEISSVYCDSRGTMLDTRVYCHVEGITMINNFTIYKQNKACEFLTDDRHTPYGKNGTNMWVVNGCQAVFTVCGCHTVCGEDTATTISETEITSTTSTATQTASTGSTILTDQSDFSTSPSLSHSMITTATTKDVQGIDTTQLTLIVPPPSQETLTVVTGATSLSHSTQSATNERPLSTRSIPATSLLMSTLLTTTTMSMITTTNDHSFKSAITVGSSSFKSTDIPRSYLQSTLTTTFAILTGNAQNRSEDSASMDPTPLTHCSPVSQIAPTDKSRSDDVITSLGAGAIVGIISGGLSFIMLCLLMVSMLKSHMNCNSISPIEGI